MNNPAYYEAIVRLLSEIQHSQAEAIDKVADLTFSSLVADGVLHIFGSGHSHSVAEEAFHRVGAGGEEARTHSDRDHVAAPCASGRVSSCKRQAPLRGGGPRDRQLR